MLDRTFGKHWLPRLRHGLLTALALALSLLWAIPLLWAVVASLRPPSAPLGRGDIWFSFPLTVENYVRAWSLAPFNLYYVNTYS